MTYIYSSFYCAVCSSDTAGKKLDFKTSEGTGATGVNLGKHWKTIDSFCFPPSPKTIELFEKALPFPENHWSVWKISPRPLPLWPGRGQGRGPLHSMSPSVLSSPRLCPSIYNSREKISKTHHSIWKKIVLVAHEHLERLEGKIWKCIFFYVKTFWNISVDWQWSKKCSNTHLCSWDFFPE